MFFVDFFFRSLSIFRLCLQLTKIPVATAAAATATNKTAALTTITLHLSVHKIAFSSGNTSNWAINFTIVAILTTKRIKKKQQANIQLVSWIELNGMFVDLKMAIVCLCWVFCVRSDCKCSCMNFDHVSIESIMRSMIIDLLPKNKNKNTAICRSSSVNLC